MIEAWYLKQVLFRELPARYEKLYSFYFFSYREDLLKTIYGLLGWLRNSEDEPAGVRKE